MTENPELLYQISLKLVPGIGDVLMKNLMSYCGSASAVFKTPKARLMKVPGIGEILAEQICAFKDFSKAESELVFMEKNGITPYFYLDDAYPYRLRDLPDSPCLLFGSGQINLNPERMLGIVGTRKASEYGKSFTHELVKALKLQHVQVVSGLALGIDGIAHKACIEQQIPTLGVLAHGLDRVYPSQHQALAKRMMDNGGLLTEYPSNTNPDRENFPKRNRIVAGLCDVLLVIETAIKGGARITAEIANTYNREVMAVPGRVGDYYSQGCNALIKEHKAHMLTGIQDVLDLMGWLGSTQKKQTPNLFNQLNEPELSMVAYMRQKTKVQLDEMAFDLNMDPGTLALKLLELEFNGYILSLPGKCYELK